MKSKADRISSPKVLRINLPFMSEEKQIILDSCEQKKQWGKGSGGVHRGPFKNFGFQGNILSLMFKMSML